MFPRDIVAVIITSVIMICVFTFISVKVWADQRRREREAFYHSEVLKKLSESTGDQARQVIEMMREEERTKDRQSREGGRLAGWIVTGVGIGLCAMFAIMVPGEVWGIGLIPLFVGLALLLYNYVLAPKTPEA